MRLWTILLLSLSIVAVASWLDVAEVEAAAFRHQHRRELALEGAQVEALVEEHRELHQLRRQVAERVAQSFSHHRLRLLIEP